MRGMTTRRTVLGAMSWSALGALGAGLFTPASLFAQAKIPTVAVLYAGESDDDEPVARPFFQQMERSGWVEGKNVNYDRHSGKGARPYLATMVSIAADRQPDLIYATTASLAAAVFKEAATPPMVFTTTVDPVSAGLVDTLSKPGRNATGVLQVVGDAAPTRFKLVCQALPAVKRLGAIFDRSAQDYQARKAAHEKAAQAVGLELVSEEFTNFEAIARILANFKRAGITVAEMTPSFALIARRREAANLAALNGIALVAHRHEWAEAGALLTYGVDVAESHRRAARIADRILRGAKAADIPVERVQKFELVINARTASTLGLQIPQPVLKRADRVIT